MVSFIGLTSKWTEIERKEIELLNFGEKSHDQKIMLEIGLKITNLWFFGETKIWGLNESMTSLNHVKSPAQWIWSD